MDSFYKTCCKSILAGSSPIYNTSARRKRHECNTNNTSTTKCDTSATLTTRVRHEWKILITTRVKTYFYTLTPLYLPYYHIFTPLYLLYRTWKTTRRETISFEELAFGDVSFPCQNAFKKCTTKTKLFNKKRYIKMLYTRL